MSWTTKTSFPNAAGIFAHSVTILPGNKFLVSGGESLDSMLNETLNPTSYIYDTGLDSWSVTGSLNNLRVQSRTIILNNGKILTVGGRSKDIDGAGLSTCELYDPVATTWANTGSLNFSRYGYGIWKLNSGDIMVAGGHGGGGIGSTPRPSTEIYSVSGGTWSNAGHDLPEDIEWPYYFALADGTPVVAAGNRTAGTISVYKYNTSTGWSVLTTFPVTGFIDTAEAGYIAKSVISNTLELTNGQLMICATNFSATQTFAPSNVSFIFDFNSNTITQKGSLNTARTFSMIVPLNNSGVFVSSGQDVNGNDVHTVELYNFSNNTWSIISENPPSFQSAAATINIGTTWYQLGGQINNAASSAVLLAFTPTYTQNLTESSTSTDTTRKVVNKNLIETQLPVDTVRGRSNPVSLQETVNVNTWTTIEIEPTDLHWD